jgi:AcrR family transcriptional regulator
VAAPRSNESERLRQILERAARIICRQGFEATSMQEIAEACGLTKAGLYHHIRTKDALLLAIMNYGMDLFEELVLDRVAGIADPLERLRATMARNVELVTQDSSKEVTIILHEHQTLTGAAQREINARKKRYVSFLEDALREAIERRQIRPVDPTLAAFSFLGVVLWTYKWYRADGRISSQQLADGMTELFFEGLLPR